MARISLSPTFIRDSLTVLKDRGLKGLIFGKKVELNEDETKMVADVAEAFPTLKKQGAKSGQLNKIDALHKGKGKVYLVSHPKAKNKSLVIFEEQTKIANGPDLWLYVSKSSDPRASLGEFINLGLIKGNKGGQIYEIDQSIQDLSEYQTAIIYCKQFEVLFSYAELS